MSSHVSTPRAGLRRNWRLAAECAPALLRPSRYNGELMVFVLALAGPSLQRQYDRFCGHPEGRRLLEERPDLRSHLTDVEGLAALPDGSFGRCYHDFIDGMGDINAPVDHLQELADRLGWDEDVRFFVARGMQTHDMWHTLTGYGLDWAGEAAVVAFTYGQVPFLGTRMLYWGTLFPKPGMPRRRWLRFLREARLRGRAGHEMLVAPYEELLGRPIEEVRSLLGVRSMEEAHPRGVPVSAAWPGFADTRPEGAAPSLADRKLPGAAGSA